MTDPRTALTALREAAAAGRLGALCERHGVRLLVVFGSAVRPDGVPNDLDLAVQFGTPDVDVLAFLDEIMTVAGTSKVDLMDLGAAAPVARERALVGGEPLVELKPGSFVRAQLAAMMERMDTEWLRRLRLELLAE